MRRILFVCTGNTCRSPMAEAILARLAREEGLDVEVRSAGVSAVNGSPASSQAIQVLREKGIEHEHRSRTVDKELVEWADLILTMASGHKTFLIHDFPECADKVYTLKEYAHLDARVEELYRRLDRVYAEMEAIRAGIRSRHGLKADEPWSREAEEEWNRETEELRREERELARQLERRASDLDVADPFGGPVEVYRECAGELEEAIRRMIRKWKEEREEGEHRN